MNDSKRTLWPDLWELDSDRVICRECYASQLMEHGSLAFERELSRSWRIALHLTIHLHSIWPVVCSVSDQHTGYAFTGVNRAIADSGERQKSAKSSHPLLC